MFTKEAVAAFRKRIDELQSTFNLTRLQATDAAEFEHLVGEVHQMIEYQELDELKAPFERLLALRFTNREKRIDAICRFRDKIVAENDREMIKAICDYNDIPYGDDNDPGFVL